MKKLDAKFFDFTINENATVEEAMKTMTVSKRGALIIVDAEKHVVGVASDGDIRRALIKGATILIPVYKVMNPNVKTVTSKDKEVLSAPQTFFDKNRHIHLLPVVDKDNKLIDILEVNYPHTK